MQLSRRLEGLFLLCHCEANGAINVIKLRVNYVKNRNLFSIEKPPHPLGTPPKEGKSRNSPPLEGCLKGGVVHFLSLKHNDIDGALANRIIIILS
jgi:hypothetical protein